MTRRLVLLSPVLALAAAFAACGEPPPRPGFVLMVAEALHAEGLGCGGAPDARTPHLDALARSGLQFRTCVSQSPRSLPALATIFTGRFPSGHGATLEDREVAPGVPMLAESIRSRGYRTAAFLEGNIPPEGNGLERGFDVFDTRYARTSSPHFLAVVDSALSWVRSDWKPCFLAVSLSGWSGKQVDQHARYFLRGLAEHATARHAFFVFTALQGYPSNADGTWANAPLDGRLLNVPMFVAAPQWIAPALRDDPAMLIDVFPTALQCLGFAPTRVPGRGLIRNERDGGEGASERPLCAEVAEGDFAKSVQLRDWRAVHDEVAGTWRLHDLAADPGETRDVAADHPEKLAELQAAMPEPGAFDVPVRRSD